MITRYPVQNLGAFRIGQDEEKSPIMDTGTVVWAINMAEDRYPQCITVPQSDMDDLKTALYEERWTKEQAALAAQLNVCVTKAFEAEDAAFKERGPLAGIPTWAYVAGGAAAAGLIFWLATKSK